MNEMKWSKIETVGVKPSARYKQQAVLVGDKMYVLGGGSYKPPADSVDVYCLDLRTFEWCTVDTKGQIPISRVAHSCDYDSRTNSIYMWGGFTSLLERLQDFNALDLSTMTWKCLDYSDCDKPSPRAFHGSCLYNDSIYIFGGADGDTRHSDLWEYQLSISPPSLMTLAAKAAIQPHGIEKMQRCVPGYVLQYLVPQDASMQGKSSVNFVHS
eukprot:CAMPEP_0113939592 /NCGR_PEP_ID=MMETSP1339-20121228/5889_1 /TAXON_ID=94617 /ORGANISM="Fibrocapsa japonica" /LENGTH=211 /DNA_ID=CAMNT_0000943151 /DNA_START=243 /DNA_END=878 /DNA_ORIENTATION=+ /assembly_acc=CAM_ASM_000762